ncbi:MAG TPA: LUD domain-containing protein [Rhodothermales bacterium]|nr:LUD domain-containing protein [Rhodothermales bacterium]
MSSRDDILRAVGANKPSSVPLPEISTFDAPGGRLITLFTEAIQSIGGQVEEVDTREDVASLLTARYPDAMVVASLLPEMNGTVALDGIQDPHELADLDVLVCEGEIGVAENGAIWLPESAVGHRAAPFITQHLAVVLDKRQIVWNMHDAYARVQVDAEGFGVFVAGPSKTADIEQSLVIGAHGPRSLTVFLVGSSAESKGRS